MLPKEILNTIIRFLSPYGVRSIRLFGSYAKGEQTQESDIDLLVEFVDRISLLKIARIERELSEKTGYKIDLLTNKSISPLLINRIYSESVLLEL